MAIQSDWKVFSPRIKAIKSDRRRSVRARYPSAYPRRIFASTTFGRSALVDPDELAALPGIGGGLHGGSPLPKAPCCSTSRRERRLAHVARASRGLGRRRRPSPAGRGSDARAERRVGPFVFSVPNGGARSRSDPRGSRQRGRPGDDAHGKQKGQRVGVRLVEVGAAGDGQSRRGLHLRDTSGIVMMKLCQSAGAPLPGSLHAMCASGNSASTHAPPCRSRSSRPIPDRRDPPRRSHRPYSAGRPSLC